MTNKSHITNSTCADAVSHDAEGKGDRCPASGGRYLVAKLDGPVDVAKWFERRAGAMDGDVAIVEQPTDHRLVDVHTLDLVHIHFHRTTLDEALSIDHAEIGWP